MRGTRWAWPGILALMLAGSAGAQNFSSGLTGIKPSDVKFKEIDTSGALRAPLSTMSNTSQSRFSLTGVFRSIFTPNTKPIRGQSMIPGPQYPAAVSPLMPVNSTVPVRR